MEFIFSCSPRYLTTERSSLLCNYLSIKTESTLITFKKGTRCHSLMALNRVSDANRSPYCYFSRVGIRFFSVLEIPVKHASLYDKYRFQSY